MRIERPELKSLVVQVATEVFDDDTFRRRPLREAVEKRIKEMGLGESSDNVLSGSAGLKSKGLANIDWAITSSGSDGGLLHVGRDKWSIPKLKISK